jgi:hypothetical protein
MTDRKERQVEANSETEPAVNAAQPATLESNIPGLREALLRSPTVPPIADASVPAMANATRFVVTLLAGATAFAWLVLPSVM